MTKILTNNNRVLHTVRRTPTLDDLHALQFVGTNRNSLVYSPNSSLLNITTAGSLECWIYKTSNASLKQFIGQGSTGNQAFFLYGNSGAIQARVGNGTTSALPAFANSINTLYHVCLTYDASDSGGMVRLYSNGVEVNNAPLTGPIELTADKSFSIGGLKANGITGRNYIGTIDNARLYNRCLTPTEVAEHYTGVFNDDSGLLINWNLDNVTDYGVPDMSGNNFHGVIADTAQVTVVNRLVDF